MSPAFSISWPMCWRAKYADHLPLYRQSRISAREGLDLDRSALADRVGRSTALLEPLADAAGRHVLAAEAIFADGEARAATGPGPCRTSCACWRRAPAGSGPPGTGPRPARVRDIHQAKASPFVEEAIRRTAQLHAVEKEARGLPPDRRVELRQARAAPVLGNLGVWPCS